jgi:hypothetical protein
MDKLADVKASFQVVWAAMFEFCALMENHFAWIDVNLVSITLQVFDVQGPALRWKAEYLYVDLGSLDAPPGSPAVICTRCRPPRLAGGGQIASHTNFTDNLVRVGLNYKFY